MIGKQTGPANRVAMEGRKKNGGCEEGGAAPDIGPSRWS
jgi:hypothetical protein